MKSKNNIKSDDRYKVPAIEQAARILCILAEAEASHLSLTEICDKSGIHSGRAFTILHTLQKFGFTQRNIGGKGYSLGPGLLMLSRKVLDSFNIPRLAEPILEELAKKANSAAIFGLIVDDQIFVIAKSEGRGDMGITVQIGRRFSITHGAEGKAIAAFMPEKRLDEILQQKKIYFHDKSGKVDRRRLPQELAECRRSGYALDLGEMKQKLNAVAAPVLGSKGIPIGHISIIGILSPDQARQLGPLVAEAGKKLSSHLGAMVY